MGIFAIDEHKFSAFVLNTATKVIEKSEKFVETSFNNEAEEIVAINEII